VGRNGLGNLQAATICGQRRARNELQRRNWAQIDAEIADEILEDGWQDGTDVEIEL